MPNVFIYALCDPRNHAVRYVGKAKKLNSRLNSHLNDKTGIHKARWIQSLVSRNLIPNIVILEEVEEHHWKEAERDWIAYYRSVGANLTNHTAGGDGLHGAGQETRAKLSRIAAERMNDPVFRSRVFTPERAAKISAALTGRAKSPEHVAKLPQNQVGRKLSDQQKEKIRATSTGRTHKPETIDRLRQLNLGNQYGLDNRSRTGQTQSEAERLKKSEATKGRPKSPEHREKIRQGQQLAWARRKAEREHLCQTLLDQADAPEPADSGD